MLRKKNYLVLGCRIHAHALSVNTKVSHKSHLPLGIYHVGWYLFICSRAQEAHTKNPWRRTSRARVIMALSLASVNHKENLRRSLSLYIYYTYYVYIRVCHCECFKDDLW